jgi:tetratricopeptide (TPR) repeat protein
MARRVVQGPPILDRIHVDRIIANRGGVLSMLGTERASGTTVVVKELAQPRSRPLPPADEKRVVWTRLILPTDVESADGVTRTLRPFLEGTALDELIAHGASPWERSLGIAIDVLRGLDTLHSRGCLHGAVKPRNIVITSAGRAWLVDPTLTNPIARPAPSGTGPEIETTRYLSPEGSSVGDARVGEEVDVRSDLYSVGVVVFECLTGRPLYDATDPGELLRAQMLESPRSIREVSVAAPRAFDEIVGRLLRKDPRDRYATASGVLHDLLDLERGMQAGEPDRPVVIGMGDVRTTLAEPGLVGRVRELTQIEDYVAQATQGRGGLVLLEAESGDGKTRLLDEVALVAAHRGTRVFRAEAHELEAPRPFAMLEGLAASILDAAAEDPRYAEHLARSLGPWSWELRTALPSLGRLLTPDAGEGRTPASEGRLRDALAVLFDALGTPQRPALILLDDCQWADGLSLGVIGSWSADTSPTERFVSVVTAVRTEEAARDQAVGRWAEATLIVLPRLTAEEMRDLASSMGGPMPDITHTVIAQLSHGRPFFVTSVLRGMVESATLRPGPNGWEMDLDALASLTSSRQATTLVTHRLQRLTDETLGFLSGAAVWGRHASVEESAALAEIDEGRVHTMVEEARRAGLIWTPEPREGLSFIHDMVREGALQRLDDEERRSLHRRAAELIERTRPADVFDLAYHYDRSGALGRAVAPALEAASVARSRQALESAETMLQIAARGSIDADPATRLRVAEELGSLLMLRGSYDGSARWLGEARSLVPPGAHAAEIEGKIGELAFKRGDVRTAADSVERALRMIGRRVPRRRVVLLPLLGGELVVQMLHSLMPAVFVGRRSVDEGATDLLASRFHGRLGYAWWFERGKIATLWTHLRSMNIAERYPPTPELAQAYSEHAPAMMLIPWHRRGVRYARQSHAIRVQLGDRWGQGQSLHFWGAGLYAASEYDASLTRMREALELLEQTGDQWELNNCRLQIAMARYRLGDLAGAAEDAKAAWDAGLDIGDPQARGIGLEAWAKSTDGQVPEQEIRAELERSSEDVLTIAGVLQAEGVRLLGIGEPSSAVGAFEESQRLFRRAGMKNAGVSPIRPWLLTALLRDAEATPRGDRRQALVRRARSVARQASRRARFYRNDLPHVLRERARLAALGGRRRRAKALFARSIEVAADQGALAETLRTRISRGQVGVGFGWTDAAADGALAEVELRALISERGTRTSTASRVSRPTR